MTSIASTRRACRPAKTKSRDTISAMTVDPSFRRCRYGPERCARTSRGAAARASARDASSSGRMSVIDIRVNSSREYPYWRTAAALTDRNINVSASITRSGIGFSSNSSRWRSSLSRTAASARSRSVSSRMTVENQSMAPARFRCASTTCVAGCSRPSAPTNALSPRQKPSRVAVGMASSKISFLIRSGYVRPIHRPVRSSCSPIPSSRRPAAFM